MEFTVHRDAHGIPHLRARTHRDLAYAQGWNATADRAEQIEITRRRAEGTAAALLGPDLLPWDRFSRRALVADTGRRAFAALDQATAAWIAAYADGVNDGLAANPVDGLAPGRWEAWTPVAVWFSEHILFGSGGSGKLWRDRVAEVLGEDAATAFAIDGHDRSGSNGWMLTPDRTATGAAILAGDPHRFIESPGIYQQIHLACDDYDVLGLAVPGIPGIAHFGHAGDVAWGITNAMADAHDLYTERLRRSDDGLEALGPDGWRPARTWTETIEVAGAEPETVEVVETDRGPVVSGGPDADHAISLASPERVDADLGFAALPALLRARTVADVDAALDAWVTPVNVVLAADVHGGLLHRVAGRVPMRDKANGLRPVPAWEAPHAWRGRHESAHRAPGAITVMANHRGIADGIGVEYAPPHRADRIHDLLDERDDWTAADMAAIHTDVYLPSAGPLLDRLAALDGLSADAERFRERLLSWDRRMDAASTDATAFAALRSAVVRELAGLPRLAALAQTDPARHPQVFAIGLRPDVRIAFALEHLLKDGRGILSADECAAAVRGAVESVATDDLRPWGELHRVSPLRRRRDESQEDDWPGLGGDHDCVLSTSSVPGVTDRFVRAPAARWVWDLARREDSRWVVPMGASGVMGDPHERDQMPLWRKGELIPVAADWSALEEERTVVGPPVGGPVRRAAVYERDVPGIGRVGIVPVDPRGDLDLIYGWVTEERARFWRMLGHSRERVLGIYEYLDASTTHHAYLVCRDGEPVALFQTYAPDADPVGECYEVEAGDFGIHLLVARAERAEVRAGFAEALVGTAIDFGFADPATRRIVAEPDARNANARARLRRTGFELGPEIDLPDKRARLAFLTREAWEQRG
jgi:penicillin G amidase